MSNPHSTAALRSFVPDRSSPPTPPPQYPWRTRIAVPVGIVVALMLLTAWSARELLLPVTDVRVVPVVMRPANEASRAMAGADAPASAGKAAVTMQATGWIEPSPYATAVASLTDGTVREILVLEGQTVRAGDVLVRLVDDDAKLAAARAEAELAMRRAEAEAAKRRWEHPIERDREIAVTAAMLEESRAELNRLPSDIEAEQARANELADQLKRQEALLSAQAVSERDIQSTRFRLEAQRATVIATKARQFVIEAQLRRREADAKAAREAGELRIDDKRLLNTATSAAQIAEAQLAEANLRLQRTQVKSPADGVVMSLLVESGSKLMLSADAPTSAYVARLYDPSKLQVRVDVPLADAAKVEIGQPVEVFVESVPGRGLRGDVVRAVHQADITKNTVQFKVRLLETAPALKPEMLARVRFHARPAATAKSNAASQSDSALGSHFPFVPESLVQHDGALARVVTVDRADRVARVRQITLGQTRHNGWVAVTDGLSAGDALIAEPSGVRDGRRVRVLGEIDGQLGKEGP